ncbi:lysylphosphatidylglycerol synthase transmembrane domain-containing protein [Pedobacter sp. P351]|uniref:lysylphosphatidylglycerol synthase transmembrane domain-containing protein n=1 Tax=Pedobacter superstes TaxID=3133441 RepID=UPI00309F85A9
MELKKVWNHVKTPLKIVITIALIYVVFQKIDFRDIKKLYLTSNLLFIFLAFLAYFFSQVVSSWRLLSFLKSIGINVSLLFNFKLYLLGLFYNIYGGIGGDGYKIYLLRKRFQKRTRKIIFAILLDRVSGLWAIGFLFSTLILLIPRIKIHWYIIVPAVLLGTLIYYAVLQYFFLLYNRNFIKAHLKAIVVQSLQLVSVMCILLAQDFNGKFSPYLFSFLVSSIAAIIPIGAFGFGTREYVMIHISDFFNMNQSLAVFVTFTFSILSTLVALTGIWFVYRSKEFEPLPTEEEAEDFEKKADKAIEE